MWSLNKIKKCLIFREKFLEIKLSCHLLYTMFFTVTIYLLALIIIVALHCHCLPPHVVFVIVIFVFLIIVIAVIVIISVSIIVIGFHPLSYHYCHFLWIIFSLKINGPNYVTFYEIQENYFFKNIFAFCKIWIGTSLPVIGFIAFRIGNEREGP